MAGKTILLDRTTISNLIEPTGIVDALEHAVRAIAATTIAPPPKAIVDLSFVGETALAAAIFGHMGGDDYLTIKLGQERTENPNRNLPTTNSWINLYNMRTGELLAITDGGLPTMLRTAGMAALSIRHMARKDSKVLTIVGAGGQLGRCCIQICSNVLGFEKVYLVDHFPEAAQKARDELQGTTQACLELSDIESACRASDVIVTATASRAPIVKAEWVQPGTHLACMGADLGPKIELEPALTASAYRIADEPEHARARGEVSQSIESGLLDPNCFAGSIKELVLGTVPGRINQEAITLYDGVGVGYQDTAILSQLYHQAVDRSLGTQISFS